MPYVAGAVLIGYLASVLWPDILIMLGLGAIFAIIGWMIENPIFGIGIVVTIYWLDSVYIGWSTTSDDASLEQGGRGCITIRAATIAVVLSLLAYIPVLWALIGSVGVIVTIRCLEKNGTIVKYEAIGDTLEIGPDGNYNVPPREAYRRSQAGHATQVAQCVAQWRRPGFKDPRQKEIERRTRNYLSGRTAKF